MNEQDEETPLHIESVPSPSPNNLENNSSGSTQPSPPLDLNLDLLSFDQRGAVIQQLWLNCATTEPTMRLCKRVVERPESVAELGLAESIASIRNLINTSISSASTEWLATRDSQLDRLVKGDSYERDRYEKEYGTEEGGPNFSPALLPVVSLILFLSTSHPTLVSLPASKAAFNLLLELVQRLFPSENSLPAPELSARIDEALMKVVRTRWRLSQSIRGGIKGDQEKWDVKGDLKRIMGSEFERARRKGCKLELVGGFLDDLVEEGRGGGGERQREKDLGERVRLGSR